MKKIIKTITLLLIIFIPTFIVLDSWIIKTVIIKKIESLTNKKTTIERLNIGYFPSIKLDMENIKIPNPSQDNYLITAEKLTIKINLIHLFHKSITIEELISNNTTLFDNSSKITLLDIEKEPKEPSIKTNQNNKNIFNETLKTIIEKISIKDYVKADIKELNFENELNEIDTVINNSNSVINSKKDIILTDTNSILYKINSLKTDNINTINQLNEFNKNIKTINQDTEKIKTEISNLNSIYLESINKIDDIETDMLKKINESVTFNISNNTEGLTSNFSKPIEIIFNQLISRLKPKEKKNEKQHFSGITYQFKTNNYPLFLIKKLKVNTLESNTYLNGEYLTLSTFVKEPFVFNAKIKNQENFRRLTVDINSMDKETFYISQEIKNLIIKKRKIYEDDSIKVDLLENNTTYTTINGQFSNNTDIDVHINLENPIYRVVNKKTESNLKESFFNQLNNQDIQTTINITGEPIVFTINTTTNLDHIISETSKRIISDKIENFQTKQKNAISKIKKDNRKKVDEKITNFDKSYNNSITKMNFQLNEITSQKKDIEDNVKKQKTKIEEETKNKFSDDLKNLLN